MVTNPNIAPDPSPGRFNSALPLQGHSPGRRRRRRDRGRPENIQTTETGRGVTRKSSGVVTAGKDRHNASIAGQGSYSVCRTRTGCARNPRRFDSGGAHQFSVDTRNYAEDSRMGFRKSRNEAPQAVCCNCGLQTDQKTVEERSADSRERPAINGTWWKWITHWGVYINQFMQVRSLPFQPDPGVVKTLFEGGKLRNRATGRPVSLGDSDGSRERPAYGNMTQEWYLRGRISIPGQYADV